MIRCVDCCLKFEVDQVFSLALPDGLGSDAQTLQMWSNESILIHLPMKQLQVNLTSIIVCTGIYYLPRQQFLPNQPLARKQDAAVFLIDLNERA